MLTLPRIGPVGRNVALTALLSFISVVIISAIISENEDVEFKFYAIKAWAAGDFPSFPANHHNLRWAINLPAVLWVALFGDSPASYLTFNYLIFALCTAGMFWLGRTLTSAGIALVILALWFLNPVVYSLAPLLMPELFSIFYLILGLILLYCAYADSSRTTYAWSMLALFFMYGAKETNLFFMPGLALFELARRNYQRLAIMIAVFGGGLLVETLVVDFLLRDQSILFGRSEAIVRGPHVAEMYKIFSYYTLADVPRRWWFTGATLLDRLSYISKAIYLAFFAASAWLIWRKFSAAPDGKGGRASLGAPSGDAVTETIDATVALGLSFAFITTFFIISWHPFVLGQPLVDRYLWVLLVPSILVVGFVLYVALEVQDSAFARSSRIANFARHWLTWTNQRRVTPVLIIAIIVVGTLSRLAMDAGIVSKRREGHSEPYTIFGANAYYRTSVREPLVNGCTVIFANRRAAWSGLIFAFPYRFFSPPEQLYRWELNGLKIAGGGTVHGAEANDSAWGGLSEIRVALGHGMDTPYAVQFAGPSVPRCTKANYVGHLDVHPRDQALAPH